MSAVERPKLRARSAELALVERAAMRTHSPAMARAYADAVSAALDQGHGSSVEYVDLEALVGSIAAAAVSLGELRVLVGYGHARDLDGDDRADLERLVGHAAAAWALAGRMLSRYDRERGAA